MPAKARLAAVLPDQLPARGSVFVSQLPDCLAGAGAAGARAVVCSQAVAPPRATLSTSSRGHDRDKPKPGDEDAESD